jgi:hypothetical protein
MREHILVCPFDKNLLDKMHDESLVVISPGFEQIPHVFHTAGERNNRVMCVVVYSNSSLASVPFHESWKGIPIAIYAAELGPFKEIMMRLPLIRDLNLRIFLNSDKKENYTGLHILSSLQVNCGLEFGEKDMDWEALNDLMTYSLYGKVKHGAIEPFQFVANKYNPERLTEYNTIYFNNPQVYLHVDEDENIAISGKHLQQKNYVAAGLEALNDIKNNKVFEEAILDWQQHFLKDDGCAFCPSWRVCLGKFAEQKERNPGCQKFFADMMEATDDFLSKQHKQREREIWQP